MFNTPGFPSNLWAPTRTFVPPKSWEQFTDYLLGVCRRQPHTGSLLFWRKKRSKGVGGAGGDAAPFRVHSTPKALGSMPSTLCTRCGGSTL